MSSPSLVLSKRRGNSGGLSTSAGRTLGGEDAQRPARRRPPRLARYALSLAAWLAGCDTPSTFVVLDNRYPESTANAAVVYQAFWQAISFQTPLPPGSSSSPLSTTAASANLAYVVLAPGWEVTSSTPPTSLVVMQSRSGFSVSLNQTLHIPVEDATFAGNCAAGSVLSQAEVNFLTEIVFATLFMTVSYDAASCTTTPKSDAGGS
jgi:hypothetical protein